MPSFIATASALAPGGLLGLSSPGLLQGIFYVLCLILCVAVHEFGHAYVADRLGDPVPRAQGRVTLNPLAHIDLFGTVILPLVLVASGSGRMFGWGKPVEWSAHPRYLTRRFSLRMCKLLVSVAGPAMNLGLALVLSLVFIPVVRFGQDGESTAAAATILRSLIDMNLLLMFFNLLPIPPLDGRSFLYFLPDSLAVVRDTLMKYGGLIFLVLVVIGPVWNGQSPLGLLMTPFYYAIDQYDRLLFLLASPRLG